MGAIALDTLTFDPALWPRLKRDPARVAHLVDVLEAGGTLPAIKVQEGTTLVLGGWHTAEACRRIGYVEYLVEFVDVPAADRLLYAYREDMTAALPYSPEDTQSVAERLYQQRSNGSTANVTQIARDLGRPEATIRVWLSRQIERDRQRHERERLARALVVAMLIEGPQLSQRRIAELLGVSLGTVSSDRNIAGAEHVITDDQVVSIARSLLAETAGRGSTEAERHAAADWLLAKLNPVALATARRHRAITDVSSWVGAVRRQLGALNISDLSGCGDDPAVQHDREVVLADLAAIQEAVTEIQRRLT